MQAKFDKYENLVFSLDELDYLHDPDMSESEFQEQLQNAIDNNTKIVEQIKVLFESGFDFSLKTHNHHSVFDVAVTTDNVELVKMLFDFNAPYYSVYHTPLHRAATFGALEVVKYLIEEKGLSPEKKDSQEYPVLQAARSSKHSKNVVPYLVSTLLNRKYKKLPLSGKQKELTENKVRDFLPNIQLPDSLKQKLKELIDAIFVEEHSISILEFFEEIKDQNPDLIFSCIALINYTSSKKPSEKTAKKIPSSVYVHHGDLTITSNAKVSSVMVTGNLTIEGNLQNVEGEQIYVGGNLVCENFYTEGPVIVGDNLIAKEIRAYYNDYKLDVKGTIVADKLIIEEHLVITNTFEVTEIINKGNIELICRSEKN